MQYAAVVGPTPEFVIWSLRRSCSLRNDRHVSCPLGTRRLLKGVREVYCAQRDGRVVGDIAWQRFTCIRAVEPVAQHDIGQKVLGFREDDAFAAFGGRALVEQQCYNCAANVDHENDNNALAGCFGRLPRTFDSSQPDRASIDVAQLIDRVARDRRELYRAASSDVPTDPPWYGLWIDKFGNQRERDLSQISSIPLRPVTIAQQRLEPLARLLLAAAELLKQQSAPPDSESPAASACLFLTRLARAATAAARHDVLLDVTFYPPGYSDGEQWLLCEHCVTCRAPRPDGRHPCPACSRTGGRHNVIKRRVEGVRPFRDIGAWASPEEQQAIRRSCGGHCSKSPASE